MADALMEAIIAAPDDDAPRLVWADREGGERGELVVIQCRLAHHDVPRAERRRLAAREAELLEANAKAWSSFSGAEGFATKFVRGFAEGITIAVDDLVPNVERIFERAPLLRELRFAPLPKADPLKGETVEPVWAACEANLRGILKRLPPARIRTLAISSAIELLPGPFDELNNTSWSNHHHDEALLTLLTTSPSLSELRELVLTDAAVEPQQIPLLERLRLDRLVLAAQRLHADGVVRLLREAPTITRLAVHYGRPVIRGRELAKVLACPETARLKELDLKASGFGVEDLRQFAECRALSGLERLGLGSCHPDGVGVLAKSPYLANLRELDLAGTRNTPALLEGATFTHSLRTIHARAADADALFAMFPSLECVETS